MTQTDLVIKLVTNADPLDINALSDIDRFNYAFNTFIVLDNMDEVSTIYINGILYELPGGFESSRISINTLTVDALSAGVLVIGSKTKKEIFGN
jgi:Mg2+/Co2+ transporter CorC